MVAATRDQKTLTMAAARLSVMGVTKVYHSRAGGLVGGRRGEVVVALDGVTVSVNKGHTLGVVGESGSGKSTLARVLVGLEQPTTGTVSLDGKHLWNLRGADLLRLRRSMQMVFQDSSSSFNPRRRVGDSVALGMKVHGLNKSTERPAVERLFEELGLPADMFERYPHELSGGQRQRVGIARALAVAPDIVVADEAVASLDVSVQAQVLNLFSRIRKERGIGLVFISHDLSVVEYIADDVVVLFAGRVVESGPIEKVLGDPLHPYTKRLMQSRAELDGAGSWRGRSKGGGIELESGRSGCPYLARCESGSGMCAEHPPKLEQTQDGRYVACFLCQ